MMNRRWRFRVAAILFGVLFSLVAAEIVLRIFYPFTVHERLAKLYKRIPSNPHIEVNLQDLLIPSDDESLIFVLKPHSKGRFLGVPIALNEIGVRDREDITQSPKQEGVNRILVLGDSVTFGWGVPIESTFPILLEEGLNTCAPITDMYEVYNFGIPSYTAKQEFHFFLKYGVPLKPDVILWQYCLNDTLLPGFVLNDQNLFPKDFLLLRFLRWGHVGFLGGDLMTGFEHGLIQKENPGPYYIDPNHVPEELRSHVGWDALAESYEIMKEWCDAHGTKLIVVLPADHLLLSQPDKYHDPDYDKIKHLCAELEIPVIDTYKLTLEVALEKGLETADLAIAYPDDMHPNALRNRIMARAILRQLPEFVPKLAGRAECMDLALKDDESTP